MTQQTLQKKVDALPPELQQEVADFVEFITQKYHNSFIPNKTQKNEKLAGFFQLEEFEQPVAALRGYR